MPETESQAPVPGHSKYLDQVKDELLAMDPKTVITVNVDVVAASMTILGVLDNLPVYRPGLAEMFGEDRVRKIDRLELLAKAALQAHGRYRGLDSTIQIGPLARDATKYRDVLLGEVRQLVVRDVLDPGTLGELSRTPGYKNLYLDLVQLIAIFRENEALVAEWSVVKPEYLDAAEALAERLAKAIGSKEQAGQPPAADLRNRAFSLLAHTYEECRRLITCLRWFEGDADRIAPSLHAARRANGRRRRRLDEQLEETAEPNLEPEPELEPAPAEANG